MARLAENPLIKRIEYGNSLDTEEQCVEWHAWFQDPDNELWQIDMIHIVKGSRYDGYFEKMAERITAVLTDETRQAILKLKYETPDTAKIMGVEYYQAVIQDGVRTYAELEDWKNNIQSQALSNGFHKNFIDQTVKNQSLSYSSGSSCPMYTLR